ncbi:MAG: transcription-repair coupling factor [Oscillospiraceae bacterium]
MNFLTPIIKSEQFDTLKAAFTPNGTAALFGVHPIHRVLYAAALAKSLGRPIIFVCETDAEAVMSAADFEELGLGCSSYTSRDFVFLDVEGTSHEIEISRLAALGQLVSEKISVVCCSLEALCQYTIPKQQYLSLSRELKKGGKVNLSQLTASLIAAGYSRGDRVDGKGQFAVRGGILDVFPAHSEHPLRIELFGDEIDAVCSFDEKTQRRLCNLKSAAITPVREVVLGTPDEAIASLKKLLSTSKKSDLLEKMIVRDIQNLESGVMPACTDRYMFAVYERPETLLDYLPNAILFLNEPNALEKRHENLLKMHGEEIVSLIGQGILKKGQPPFYLEHFNISDPNRATVLADVFSRTIGAVRLNALVNVRANSIPRWGGEFAMLVEDVRGYIEMGYAVVVLAGTLRAADAICHDLQDMGLTAELLDNDLPLQGTVGVCVGTLSSGFELTDRKFCLIASKRENKPSKHGLKHVDKTGKSLGSLEDLRVGDYVVHSSHGIGVFEGIHRIDHHGFIRDYIKIGYRGSDTLYVPVTQLDMVSQYISPKEDGNVKLAKLHSGEWIKTKAGVYKAVREMAKELIELYAKREQEKGIAFQQDTTWQQDFEARFAYDETDDQLRAIEEIKQDMQRERPMDRLLCGDVGVGKTEVALRAAFKCVTDDRQCAVLVPTTILAWQHFKTFSERMETYPINIAMLSRFSSPKEIKAAVEGIKNGTVDIAIGTHRLLQKDIKFKRLGLLVIDEEQRFGVAHKEKLKQSFAGVDVLTLSATPIPRTLNMAMSGIRDMSVIEEPPEDRHPVQTYVMEYDISVLADAMKRELSRGGQVYYLHNRVETIELCAAKLKEFLPDARIGIAHGQMGEDALSEIWKQLIGHECDILVCTTIIETGVDVPNCNTLIVEDADRMGLSQLYQIRGRVGRSGRRAFAYFTFRRDKVLTDISSKRLAAIRDFTSFGSGFKIAMRDLQIRGAGSVLSAKQSGHMQAVGYDTYLKILSQAISDESGQPSVQNNVECTVDISISAFIPETYIPDNESRIEMYKRIAAIETPEDAEDVIDELRDRFGDVPESVSALVSVSLVRIMASRLGIYEVKQRDRESLLFYTDNIQNISVDDYIKKRLRRVLVSAKGKSYIAIEVKTDESPIDAATEFLCNTVSSQP